MKLDTFWELIERSRQQTRDVEEQAESLTRALKELSPQEIISFEQHLWNRMVESYRWDLWAVAYIVNCGCSDDDFDDFRGWLLAQGKDRYQAALEAPERIGDWVEPGDPVECENFVYVARRAYEEKTGRELPMQAISVDWPSEPSGEPWEKSVEALQRLYPRLCERFVQ